MNYNKSDITNALNRMIDFDTKTFNSRGKMPRGAVGFVDHVCISKRNGAVFFIEVKIGKDTLSDDQINYGIAVLEASKKNEKLYYYIIDSNNLYQVLEEMSIKGFSK